MDRPAVLTCDACGGPRGDCGCAIGYADAIAEHRAANPPTPSRTVFVERRTEAEWKERFEAKYGKRGERVNVASWDVRLSVWTEALRSLGLVRGE